MKHTITVIGAGFSGALTALNLLQRPESVSVTLVDSRGTFGPGLAYTVPSDRFKLNVRARAMGAFYQDPEGFLRWLQAQEPSHSGDDFVSRGRYGRYLEELVASAARRHPESLRLVSGEVVDLSGRGGEEGFLLTLADSTQFRSRTCVLALGNLPRQSLGGLDTRVLRDPYRPESYQDMPDLEHLFVLGSSLTGVDAILEAEGRGFQGRYTVLSRHGRLPLAHEDPARLPAAHLPAGWEESGEVRGLLRLVRQESRRCGSSQPVLEAMRPLTQRMWRALPEEQRRLFLRHLRPHWEIHRHRIPSQHLACLRKLQASGRLRLVAGRLEHLEAGAARVQRRAGPPEPLSFDAGFLCAGPEGDLSKVQHPLVRSLLAQGLLQSGPMGLGVHPARGSGAPGLHVIGPMEREALWEVTAVRELRERARDLARTLLDEG